MYQDVIRDPSGGRIIRIIPDCAVVNGSILLVPAGSVAFFVLNGAVSDPYPPGRYEINTGVEPFFVRLRNLMTRGDPGISVSAFYVAVNMETVKQFGTGESIFHEKRFQLSMKAKASCSLSFSIADPRTFVERLVGMHRYAFTEDDLEPAIHTMVLGPVREAVGNYLSLSTPANFQSSLTTIGASVTTTLRPEFLLFGINLSSVRITSINVPDSEMERLHRLEEQHAKGHVATDNERYNIEQIYGGNVDRRTLAEALTGIPRGSEGPIAPSPDARDRGMSGMMASLPLQMAIYSQYAAAMQPHLAGMMGQSTSPTVICPSCSASIPATSAFCPNCGHRIRS